MAQRPQVKDLNTNTVVQPTATNIVDTYVRPAQEQTVISPLSQFVAAITPAVKEHTEQKQVAKLKREREVETLNNLRKEKQIENQLFIGQTQLENSLTTDKEYWNSLTPEEANQQIQGHFDKYISKLEDSGVDEMYIERAKLASENSATALFMAFDAQKKEHQVNLENDEFITVLNTLNSKNIDLNNEEQLKATLGLIHKHINDSALAYPTADGKPSFKRFLDLAHNHMTNMSGDTADTLLYRALETMVKPDGSSIDVMNTKERIANSSKVRGRVDSERATAAVQGRKSASINFALDKVFTDLDGTMLDNVSYLGKDGGSKSISNQEMEIALLTDQRFLDMTAGEKYSFLARVGYTPQTMKDSFTNFVNLASTIQAGEATDAQVQQLKNGFQSWEAMVNSGMDVSWIDEDTMYIMKAMKYFAQDEALAGTVDINMSPAQLTAKYGEMYTGGQVETYQIANFANAAQRAFRVNPKDFALSKTDLDSIGSKVQSSTWYVTNHGETFNANQVILDITKGAKILYATGDYPTPEAAIDVAIAIAENDYAMVESSDGTKYSFKSYNTDMEKDALLVQKINEGNQSLYSKMKPWVNQNYPQTVEGDFAIAIHPHASNPKALEIKLYIPNADGSKTMVGNPIAMDKKEFLTNDKYLNQLLVDMQPPTPPVLDITNLSGLNPEFRNILDEVDNVNYFGGSAGRPFPELPADNVAIGDIPVVRDVTEGLTQTPQEWLQSLDRTIASAAEDSDILTWLNENPPLFDVDGKRSVLNQIADIALEAAKGEKFKGQPVENNVTKLIDDAIQGTSDLGKEALDAVNEMISNATVPSLTKSAAAATIINEEGFEAVPYVDDLRDNEGKMSVGHGLQIESLEPDERALITDINNVDEDESKAVVELKVNKLADWWSNTVDGFGNLPESSQIAAIGMSYQLGKENVANEWPKFMQSIQEAGQYAQGSAEQLAALASAKFNMLYNVAEDGTVSATKWATQTSERAMRMAEGMAADTGEAIVQAGEATGEALSAAGSAIVNAIVPSAEAAEVGTAIIGEAPSADAVAAIAGARNPADVAYEYIGMSENTEDGAKAVKGFFENIVGDWNPKNQSVEKFATSNAWCAAFLTQVLRDSGIDTSSLVKGDKFNQIRAASYLEAGEAIEAPQVQAGDIMIKMHSEAERKKFKLGVAHVGIVARVEGDTVYFIGGNTGDKVELADYNIKEKDVRFRRIKGVTDLPTESLPSLLQMKVGKAGRKTADAISNGFTSLYDTLFGE